MSLAAARRYARQGGAQRLVPLPFEELRWRCTPAIAAARILLEKAFWCGRPMTFYTKVHESHFASSG